MHLPQCNNIGKQATRSQQRLTAPFDQLNVTVIKCSTRNIIKQQTCAGRKHLRIEMSNPSEPQTHMDDRDASQSFGLNFEQRTQPETQ